jgi:hypothetical protein
MLDQVKRKMKKPANIGLQAFLFCGSPTWTRTRDLRINSPSLYRLSYQGTDRNYSEPRVLCKPSPPHKAFCGLKHPVKTASSIKKTVTRITYSSVQSQQNTQKRVINHLFSCDSTPRKGQSPKINLYIFHHPASSLPFS